jgi:hypothetical protein
MYSPQSPAFLRNSMNYQPKVQLTLALEKIGPAPWHSISQMNYSLPFELHQLITMISLKRCL